MADIDLKTETPDTTLPTTGFLFGADSQAAASPSVFTVQSVATTLLGSTTLTGATVTTSSPVIDAAQTWNAGGVTFTGLKFNATDTASAAASLLMDLQTGGVSQARFDKRGQLIIPGFFNEYNIVIGDTTNSLGLLVKNFGVGKAIVGPYQINMVAGYNLIWNSGTTVSSSGDLVVGRRAAANLQLGGSDTSGTSTTVTITIAAPGVVTWNNHNLSAGTPVVFTTTGALPTGITAGTTYYAVPVTANTFQIASSVANAIAATPTVITTSGSQSGTHTGTRYNIAQRLSMQGVTGVENRLGADLIITGSQGTGNAAGGSIIFQVAPAGGSSSSQNALATALTIASNQNATFAKNVNASGVEVVFDIYVPRNISFGSGYTATLTSSGTGVAQFSSGIGNGQGFNRLQFGGATSSFPALKRSSAALQVRLADDSAFAALSCGALTATNLANGRTLQRFTPLDNQPPATNFATLDTRNSVAILDFDDATDEAAVFVGVVPEAATLSSGIKVRIFWAASTATSGDCVWSAEFEDTSGHDIDSDGFDTATTATTTTSGTSGVVNVTEITCTTIDSLAAGDAFRVKISRDANSGSDTMTGDAELVAVELQQVA